MDTLDDMASHLEINHCPVSSSIESLCLPADIVSDNLRVNTVAGIVVCQTCKVSVGGLAHFKHHHNEDISVELLNAFLATQKEKLDIWKKDAFRPALSGLEKCTGFKCTEENCQFACRKESTASKHFHKGKMIPSPVQRLHHISNQWLSVIDSSIDTVGYASNNHLAELIDVDMSHLEKLHGQHHGLRDDPRFESHVHAVTKWKEEIESLTRSDYI